MQQYRPDNILIVNKIPLSSKVVLLIDVEDYEANVLHGAVGLIRKIKLLIIFEYNYVPEEYFNIDEIRIILGVSYLIFRVRKDAFLDHDLENAWNCVALPIATHLKKY